MGAYINPPDRTKEQWLEENATLMSSTPASGFYKDTGEPVGEYRLVCLIDNGAFTAAGIAYDKAEYLAFARPDGRPRKWYAVKRELLTPEVAPDLPRYERV